MPDITNLAGNVFPVNAAKVSAVDVQHQAPGQTPAVVTGVYGILKAPLLTTETPEALLTRLGLTAAFARLSQPGGDPVWIKAEAVTTFYPPATNEEPLAKCVLWLGDAGRYVQEDPAAVRIALVAHGAKF